MTTLVAPLYTERTTCRSCGYRGFEPVTSLGDLKLNAFPATLAELGTIPSVPHDLVLCPSCGLVQLRHSVQPTEMYREYWYRSGINETMREELQDVVDEAKEYVGEVPEFVLDIGANDGTLLASYPEATFTVGVEPAENLRPYLEQHASVAYTGFFPQIAAPWTHSRFSVITAIAMCYDLEDPVGFFAAIRKHLEPTEGIVIVQFQDLLQQLRTVAFDNIVAEHLEYYTLHSLKRIVERADLQVIACSLRTINGGSLRVVLAPTESRAVDSSVEEQLHRERLAGLDTASLQAGGRRVLRQFDAQIQQMVQRVRDYVGLAQERSLVVDCYGASTKGNTLLQVCGLGPADLRQAIDRDPRKTGRLTITGIPIVGETREDPAALWLCPIWQFKTSVLAREGWFLQQGGTLLFPLPWGEIVVGRQP